jgi:DNA polymerase-3 subunit gamma/tau
LGELALYRKYRPRTSFDGVIGQPQVVATLQHAIATDRLSHAYLFTGPRGVGKTSVARLLARAANCTAKNPADRPCGKCDNCKVEIGSHLDLIEIDAASNRGIDDARALREKITSAPSMGRYKVYIIDEVHMLTTEAFNALLKTLEEPPPHALFILATTEAHKLPETIVSRTQRFSFKPIAATDIIAHLREIATAEKIEIDDGALALIAQSSRGSFRDAISLLEQVATSGQQPLTAQSIRGLLGQSDPKLLAAITTAIAGHQPAAALQALDAAMEEGVQPAQLAAQLMEHWRGELHERVGGKEGAATVGRTVAAIEAVMPVLKSHWPELALETALVQLATPDAPVSLPSAASQEPATKAAAPTAAPKAEVEAKPVMATAEPTVTPTPKVTAAATPAANEIPSPELWTKTLIQIKQHNNSLYALLRSGTTVQFEDDMVVLGCRFSFHRDRLRESKNIQIIEQALARVYGRKIRTNVQLETRPAATVPDASTELVSSALEILGGEVIHD